MMDVKVSNLTDLARRFWKEGYLVIEDFYSASVMAGLDREIVNYFGETPEYRHEEEFLARSATEVIPWFPQNPDMPDYSSKIADIFDSLERDSRLVNLTGAILGDAWSPLYSMVMFSRQGTVGQAWHQDCPPEDSSRFNLNRLVYSR
ncbi:MAG: phytanoyl-CoA dioxygenase family protein, partial [Xanthomonadales bacterium]|nr:phytanoyl-CoA dioxygenase family protein [Xanthomonadales bacterium]